LWPANFFTVRGLLGYEQLVLNFSHVGGGGEARKHWTCTFSAGQEIPPHFTELEVSLP